MESDELYELYEALDSVADKIDNFFAGDRNPNYGDLNYQRLLEQRDEIQEQIESIED